MDQLHKISGNQVYLLWRNLSFGLLMFMLLIACTKILPFYLAPVLALGVALIYYRSLFFQSHNENDPKGIDISCHLVSYCLFYCVICYCVVGITINVLYAWGIIIVPSELIFFNYPYLITLLLLPCSFFTVLLMVLRGRKIWICASCPHRKNSGVERSLSSRLFEKEARVQIYNLLAVFGLLSVMVWTYFLTVYSNVNQNDRDNYVFIWMVLIVFLCDEIYFIYRYVNIFEILRNCDEIATTEEISNISARTYVRLYVLCDDAIYVDPRTLDPLVLDRDVIDTPFQSKRNVNGMSDSEVKEMIEQSYGLHGGELRFFYGRKMNHNSERSLLRYFYFIDGKAKDCESIKVPGEWMDFKDLKKVYDKDVKNIAPLMTADLIRLATIMITSKMYDSEGRRLNNIRSYRPTFHMSDLRHAKMDFQDDKWIAVSEFNEDTPFYKLKRFWQLFIGKQLKISKRRSINKNTSITKEHRHE